MAKKRKKLSGDAAIKAVAGIKALVLDIDGVLTDGRIFYTEPAGWGASYSVIDGYGIRLLMRSGIEVCLISGGNFLSHKKRAELLGIRHAYFGDEDKLHAYETIRKDLKLAEKEFAYVGDELFDIPILERVGFAAAPPHAPKQVKDVVHYITKREGGYGCAREVCDLLLEAQLRKRLKGKSRK